MCCERQAFKLNHCRRQHVIRKARREEGAQIRPRHHISQHNVSNEPGLIVSILPGQHDCIAHVLMRSKRRLDFAEFYAKAAHLHLVICAPEILEFSRSKPAAKIAGAVYLSLAERIFPKPLRGQLRAVQVAARDTRASDIELTAHTNGHRLAIGIENVDAEMRERATNDASASSLRVFPVKPA